MELMYSNLKLFLSSIMCLFSILTGVQHVAKLWIYIDFKQLASNICLLCQQVFNTGPQMLKCHNL